MCHMSQVTCHMSHVLCHPPPVTNDNSHRPSPADSSIIHSRLVPEKKKKNNNNNNNHGQRKIVKMVLTSSNYDVLL